MTRVHTPQSAAGAGETMAGALLQGVAFVLLCLWTRTSPDDLRDQLTPGLGAGPALGS